MDIHLTPEWEGYFNILRNHHCFPQWLHHFTFPPRVPRSFNFSITPRNLMFSGSFDSNPTNRCEVIPHCSFLKYILLIMPLHLSHPPLFSLSPLHSLQPTTPLHPTLSSCPWVVHISSLASTFPILFLTSPCLFCTYHLYYLFPVPFLPFLWFCSYSSCLLSSLFFFP